MTREISDLEERSIKNLKIHIHALYCELKKLYAASYIFKSADEDWNKRIRERNIPENSMLRNILFEALSYQVFVGLNKVFANKNEYSLAKATNQIEQSDVCTPEVQKLLKEIAEKRNTSLMVQNIRKYRDKLFAHLDREYAFLHTRTDPIQYMSCISLHELEEWIYLIGRLYTLCFDEDLILVLPLPTEDEISQTFFWQKKTFCPDANGGIEE